MRWDRTTGAMLLVAAPLMPLRSQPTPATPSHPAEVALVDEGALGSVYRRFPTSERLYTYDRDPRGRSVCNIGCASAWPPVLAPTDAVPVGEWSVIRRHDGKRQWALRGKPVYSRFHDTPAHPTGDGIEGVWRLVPYSPTATNPPL